MDNKKWYKRIATCFWFLLASLPFWLSAIQIILSYLIHTDSLSLADISTYVNGLNYNSMLETNSSIVSAYTPTALKDMMLDLFTAFDSSISDVIGISFAWFTWVYFIHLLVDVVVWLPKMFHSWIDRWCD